MDRRQFVKLAGLAGVGAAAAPLLAAGGSAQQVSTSDQAVTLTWWHNHPEWQQQIKTLVDQFQKAHPNITIDIIEKPGPQYPTLLTAAIAANSAPDIFGTGGSTYAQLAQSKKIHDLNGKVHVGILNDAAKSVIYVNNKIYGVPLLGEYTTGIYYWVPTFKKHKLQVPRTWTAFTDLCKTLKSHGEVPIMMPSQDGSIPTFFWTGLMSTINGAQGIQDIIGGKAKLTDPQYLQAATYLKTLVPYFAEGYESTAYVNGKGLFAEKKAVMLEGGSADYTGLKDLNPDVDLSFFAFPHPDTQGQPTVNSGPDSTYCLNSNIKDQNKLKAGITFFNYFLTKNIGSQVAKTIEMPEVNGAKVSSPIFEQIIKESKNDAPEWVSLAPLTNMWNYSLDNIANMLTGNVSPHDFAAACQRQISGS